MYTPFYYSANIRYNLDTRGRVSYRRLYSKPVIRMASFPVEDVNWPQDNNSSLS